MNFATQQRPGELLQSNYVACVQGRGPLLSPRLPTSAQGSSGEPPLSLGVPQAGAGAKGDLRDRVLRGSQPGAWSQGGPSQRPGSTPSEALVLHNLHLFAPHSPNPINGN